MALPFIYKYVHSAHIFFTRFENYFFIIPFYFTVSDANATIRPFKVKTFYVLYVTLTDRAVAGVSVRAIVVFVYMARLFFFCIYKMHTMQMQDIGQLYETEYVQLHFLKHMFCLCVCLPCKYTAFCCWTSNMTIRITSTFRWPVHRYRMVTSLKFQQHKWII